MRTTSQANGTATRIVGGDDTDDEENGAEHEAQRLRVPEQLERASAAARDTDHEVPERQQDQEDDDARRENERERGARAARPSDHDR